MYRDSLRAGVMITYVEVFVMSVRDYCLFFVEKPEYSCIAFHAGTGTARPCAPLARSAQPRNRRLKSPSPRKMSSDGAVLLISKMTHVQPFRNAQSLTFDRAPEWNPISRDSLFCRQRGAFDLRTQFRCRRGKGQDLFGYCRLLLRGELREHRQGDDFGRSTFRHGEISSTIV
jgi:hypothetical protein